ncbi:hypothetical protein E2F48_05205 [Arthrobacter crusticola]|uniref:GIY-YIG nuclease family protein n=1 Tax=Arthrobacter crusticola TaxID=2547960 RepID=A0A4R5TZB6_9MICC|nr:hypothetical protein [Arthrobacter crusticola]TDK26588.1 hypothetical protein E2F48_05205 [Arthrobacter crusticola]
MSGLVPGRRLSSRDLALFPMAAGKWLECAHLDGESVLTSRALLRVQVGIYLVTDAQDRILWLGQALRSQGTAGRMREHLRHPSRLQSFRTVRILALDDFTPPECINSIEGKAADLLRLRGTLGPRRWPTADRWPELAI